MTVPLRPSRQARAGATPRPAGCRGSKPLTSSAAPSRSGTESSAHPAPAPCASAYTSLARPRLDPEGRGALGGAEAALVRATGVDGMSGRRRRGGASRDRVGTGQGRPCQCAAGRGCCSPPTLTHARVVVVVGGRGQNGRATLRRRRHLGCGLGHPFPQGQGRRDRRAAVLGGSLRRIETVTSYLGGTPASGVPA